MASKDLFKVKDVPMTTVGGSNYDDVSDYSVRKVIYSKEGTITKVPVNNFDIANKKYVDDQIIVPGSTTTILNSGASTYKISGAVLFASGSNLAITQTGQQLKWDVIGVPTGSGTSTGANTGDQTIYATTLNASGAVVLSGAIIFASGANIDIVQTGQQIKIIGSAAAASSDMVLISSATMTNSTMVDFTGLDSTYRSFMVIPDMGVDTGTFRVNLSINNDIAGYYRRNIDAANAIVDDAAATSFALVTAGQGLFGDIHINQERLVGAGGGLLNVATSLYDANAPSGTIMIGGTVILAADLSSIKLEATSASTGDVALYGLK